MYIENNDYTEKAMRKLRIAFVYSQPLFELRGGTEKVFCDMANALVNRGHEVTGFVYDQKKGRPSFELEDSVSIINVYSKVGTLRKGFFRTLRCWGLSKKARHLNKQRFICQTKARAFYRILSRLDGYDVIVSFAPETTYILNGILGVKKPLVTMFHFDPKILIRNEYFIHLYKKSVGESNAVQVLMPKYVTVMKELYPSTNIVCIQNAAPQFDGKPMLTNKKMINVARIDTLKRPELILEALSLIKDKYPQWRFDWWGENAKNEYVDRMTRLIEERGLKNYFYFKGLTDNVSEKLMESSIFVFPSSNEGQSLSLTEAMSIGLPVIGCSDCESVSEMINDGVNGILTKPTPQALAHAISKLIDSKEYREKLGNQAKKDIAIYSPDKILKQWEELLYSVSRVSVLECSTNN